MFQVSLETATSEKVKENEGFSSIPYVKFANLANLTFRKNTVLSLTLLKHDLHLLFPMDNAR